MAVKDEVGLIFKRVIVAHLTYYPSIYVAELRRIKKMSALGVYARDRTRNRLNTKQDRTHTNIFSLINGENAVPVTAHTSGSEEHLNGPHEHG
jgi:hypothetical protein